MSTPTSLGRNDERVKLTASEIGDVEWALDAMAVFVEDEECPYAQFDLPRIADDTVWFGGNDSVLADFAYRIEVQLYDMAGEDASATERAVRRRANRSLVRKLRRVFGHSWPTEGK